MKRRWLKSMVADVEIAMMEILEGTEDILEVLRPVREIVNKIPFYAAMIRRTIMAVIPEIPKIHISKKHRRNLRYRMEVC